MSLRQIEIHSKDGTKGRGREVERDRKTVFVCDRRAKGGGGGGGIIATKLCCSCKISHEMNQPL